MIEVFVERGDQLSRSRALMKDDPEFTSALALVSIHSAIAFNDALLVKLTGKTTSRQDHMEAVRDAKKECRSKRIRGRWTKATRKTCRKEDECFL